MKKLGLKIFGGALLATSGALLAMTVLGTAQADWTDPPAGADGDTSSTVATNLWCTWYVNGVDGDINLTPADEGSEYEGARYPLEGAVNDQEALAAGWVAGENPTIATQSSYDCSWYNSEQGLSVSVQSSGDSFVATAESGRDAGMDFSLEDEPIEVTYTENPGDACSADWTLAEGMTIEGSTDPVETARIGYAPDMSTTESCSWDTTYAVSIPGGKMPAYPGEDYQFVGPTLTTTVEFLAL